MGYKDKRAYDEYEWEIKQGFINDPNGGFDEEEEDELESYGIDRFEFDMMDDDEKRAALEEVGLDPDDFEDEFLL